MTLIDGLKGETPCRQCHSQPARHLRGSLRVLYCSTTCRGRATNDRKTSSQRRREQHVVARLAAARTPAERALITWDALRAIIHRLPVDQQEDAWREVAARLTQTTASIDAKRGGHDA